MAMVCGSIMIVDQTKLQTMVYSGLEPHKPTIQIIGITDQ